MQRSKSGIGIEDRLISHCHEFSQKRWLNFLYRASRHYINTENRHYRVTRFLLLSCLLSLILRKIRGERKRGGESSSWEEIGFVRSTARFVFSVLSACAMQKWVKSMSEGRRFKKPYLLNFPSTGVLYALLSSLYFLSFFLSHPFFCSVWQGRASDDCDSSHSSTGNSHKRLMIQTSQGSFKEKERKKNI